MDDVQFENDIVRLKLGQFQDYTNTQMEYYCMGFERGLIKKRKERIEISRELRDSYNTGFNHGKASDFFVFDIFKEKLNHG